MSKLFLEERGYFALLQVLRAYKTTPEISSVITIQLLHYFLSGLHFPEVRKKNFILTTKSIFRDIYLFSPIHVIAAYHRL